MNYYGIQQKHTCTHNHKTKKERHILELYKGKVNNVKKRIQTREVLAGLRNFGLEEWIHIDGVRYLYACNACNIQATMTVNPFHVNPSKMTVEKEKTTDRAAATPCCAFLLSS